jgi:type IV pilus assembly protein PilW
MRSSTVTPNFQASTCGTELQQNGIAHFVLDRVQGALTLHQIDCATAAPWHQYRTHVYFVANDDKPGDGVPTLKRAELGGGGFTIVPLVEGIDNLQLEYGIDTSVPSVGSPAVYTSDPNSYNGCAGTTCVGNWANTVTVKIHVLARNTTTTPGYNDTKTYTLGLNADGTVNTVGPFGDAYKRHILEATVRLNNIAGRNSP